MKKYLFVLLILLLVSCQSKNEEKKESIAKNPVAKVEIEEKNDSLIYKIKENTIVIGGDTLKIETPFIYSFDGILDNNKKIQIHISNHLTEEYGGYWKSGRLYIDGENQIFGFGLIKTKKDDFYTAEVYYDRNDSEKTICNLKLCNLFTDEMYIECIYNKKTYKIYPSKKFPSYKCFDKIDYTLFDTREAYKKEEARDYYTPSRDYIFLGEILSNDKNFEALSSNLKYLIVDSLSIKNHNKWKHNFGIKKSVSDDNNYASESLSVNLPIFIDSNVYVVSDYWYQYMGGAHGLYHTSYYNYEVSTGRKIEVAQIINIKDKNFIDFYENRVRSEYGDGLSSKIEIANNFYILPTGITFCYAPYELVGFAGGEPEIFFSYEELKPYILKNTILDQYNLN